MEYIPLPFEEEWTAEDKQISLKVYLCMILSEFREKFKTENGFSENFIDLVIERRFYPAFGKPDAEKVETLKKTLNSITLDQEQKLRQLFSRKPFIKELIEKLGNISEQPIREQALEAYLETSIFLLLGLDFVYPMISLLKC